MTKIEALIMYHLYHMNYRSLIQHIYAYLQEQSLLSIIILDNFVTYTKVQQN